MRFGAVRLATSAVPWGRGGLEDGQRSVGRCSGDKAAGATALQPREQREEEAGAEQQRDRFARRSKGEPPHDHGEIGSRHRLRGQSRRPPGRHRHTRIMTGIPTPRRYSRPAGSLRFSSGVKERPGYQRAPGQSPTPSISQPPLGTIPTLAIVASSMRVQDTPRPGIRIGYPDEVSDQPPSPSPLRASPPSQWSQMPSTSAAGPESPTQYR